MLNYFLDTEHTQYKERNTHAKSIMHKSTQKTLLLSPSKLQVSCLSRAVSVTWVLAGGRSAHLVGWYSIMSIAMSLELAGPRTPSKRICWKKKH